MSESSPAADARAWVRQWLVGQRPSLELIAEDLLTEQERVEIVARDERGGVTIVVLDRALDDAHAAGDPSLLARALTHATWIEARQSDWARLAPGLGLAAGLPVRSWLVARHFDAGTRSAASALGERVRLLEARPAAAPLEIHASEADGATSATAAADGTASGAAHGSAANGPLQPRPLAQDRAQPPRPLQTPTPAAAPAGPPHASPGGAPSPPSAADQPAPEGFRSGLREEDLRVSPDERRDLLQR